MERSLICSQTRTVSVLFSEGDEQQTNTGECIYLAKILETKSVLNMAKNRFRKILYTVKLFPGTSCINFVFLGKCAFNILWLIFPKENVGFRWKLRLKYCNRVVTVAPSRPLSAISFRFCRYLLFGGKCYVFVSLIDCFLLIFRCNFVKRDERPSLNACLKPQQAQISFPPELNFVTSRMPYIFFSDIPVCCNR